MATEMISRNRHEAVVIGEGFFYHIDKLGNVVRFKPGRKKKEAVATNPIAVAEEVKV